MNDKDYEDVNHPEHYNVGIETTEYITSWGMSFVEGNIIKYVSRYKYKRGLQDLYKAEWYLKHLIKQLENESSSEPYTMEKSDACGYSVGTMASFHE
tara:strand:+ start:1680 stop:1970 length:291 start_codon:yes stop_codon:yes gene_type:complete